jgi:hypothetical protein
MKATVTIQVPSTQLGDVLAFLHKNKIADVDIKFAGSKPDKSRGNRYEVKQTEFFRELVAKHSQGLTHKEVRDAWARAGYPAPSVYSALTRAKVQKIIKVRGDKIYPVQEKSS